MLTKEQEEHVTVRPDGTIEKLIVTKIAEDGQVLASLNWRSAYTPDQSLDSVSGRSAEIAQLMWTPEVIDAYKRRVANANATSVKKGTSRAQL